MIRFSPVSEEPFIPPGQRTVGLPDFDDWWMDDFRLNSNILEYGDRILCAVRGATIDWDGAGTGDYGVSVLWADRTADLQDPRSWNNMHLTAPAFTINDLPAPYNEFYGPTTDMDFWVDPDIVTNGYQRLWAAVKNKLNNLDRADYALWDQSWTGKTIGGKQTIGFKVAFREQVKLFNGATELVRGTDYQLNNEGSSTTNGEIEYLVDHSLNTITFEFQTTSFRYAFYSDDGGVTWVYGCYFTGSDGRPHRFGQPSVMKFSEGGYSWHLCTTAGPEGSGDLQYYRSTGPSAGVWQWQDGTDIHTLGGNGSWDDTCVIGTVAWLEDDYVYLLATCGSGADAVYGNDPTAINDITDAANNDNHNDYPSAVGLWRCPKASLTTAAAWDEYSENPVALRGSVGGTMSGAMWICGRVGNNEGMLISLETVGVTRFPVHEPQALNIRDNQYGQNYTGAYLSGRSEYITGDLTFEIGIMAERLGGSIMRRGINTTVYRNPAPVAGSFYLDMTPEGALELRHYYALNQGTVERYAKTPDGVIQVGVEHTIVVSFSATKARVYIDSNTADAITGPASVDVGGTTIRFGGRGNHTMEFNGYFTKIRIDSAENTYTVMTGLADSATDGAYHFDNADFVAGSPPTIPDDSPNGYDMSIGSPACSGSVAVSAFGASVVPASPGSSLYCPGMGIGYLAGTAGSQQHLMRYDGIGFAAEWDIVDFADLATVTIENLVTGRYLAAGAMQTAAYTWTIDKAKGFWRLSSGGNFLETSDRYGAGTTLSLQTPKETYSSPYLRYDQQHWHPEQITQDVFVLRNRACGRVLRDNGYNLVMAPWSGDMSERWIIKAT